MPNFATAEVTEVLEERPGLQRLRVRMDSGVDARAYSLVELTGLPKPDHLDGQSLSPQLKDPQAPRDQPAVTTYQTHISVRTERYRYIRYADGSEELYDRSEDPCEWKNLASAPGGRDIIKKLAGYLPAPGDMAPMRPRKKRGNKDRKNKEG